MSGGKVLERTGSKLPRIPIDTSGRNDNGRKGKDEDDIIISSGEKNKTTSSSSGSAGGTKGTNSGLKGGISKKLLQQQHRGLTKAHIKQATSTVAAEDDDGEEQFIPVVPVYLDPQPKYFKDHWSEDMVVEPFDPMADSEEEEAPVLEEAFTMEYDDEFDYEKLYLEESIKGVDDYYDEYTTVVQGSGKGSSSAHLAGDAERREVIGSDEGDEEEEEGQEEEDLKKTEDAAGDNNNNEDLEECEDRSDDEIAQERMLQALYENAFKDIMALEVTREAEPEAPSITQKSLGEYFKDREEEMIAEYGPEFQEWFYTEGSEVLHRRKILACLDSILMKERIKYHVVKEEFKRRWEQGQAKQVTIDGALIKFDSYYRETLGKRNRAITQTTHEMGQKIEKVREVNRNRKELECLLRLQHQCDRRLERFRIFERYLERVRDQSHGEFSDIRDIIDRYGVLSQARQALITRDVKNQDRTDRAQNALKRNMELRSNELLVYNNYLSELRVYRDNVYEEILQLEEMLLHIKTTAAERTLLIGRIKMAINNLYLGLCKQLGRAGKIPPEDTFRQLNYVKGSMKEIIKLSRDVKRMLMAAAQAADRERRERERAEQEARGRRYKHGKEARKVNDYAALFRLKKDDDE